MEATKAVKLVHEAANAYCTVGSDGSTKGYARKWVAALERKYTKKLLTALMDRSPTKQEVEAALSD